MVIRWEGWCLQETLQVISKHLLPSQIRAHEDRLTSNLHYIYLNRTSLHSVSKEAHEFIGFPCDPRWRSSVRWAICDIFIHVYLYDLWLKTRETTAFTNFLTPWVRWPQIGVSEVPRSSVSFGGKCSSATAKPDHPVDKLWDVFRESNCLGLLRQPWVAQSRDSLRLDKI